MPPAVMGIAIAIGLLVPLLPAPAMAHTLIEALSLTYQNNAKLAAARAELRATDEAVNQALAPSRPSVQVNGSTGFTNQQTRDIATLAPPEYNATPSQFDLKVVQNIWRGGRTDAEERAALKQVYAARAGLVVVEQTALYSATTDYMNVYAAQQILKINEDYAELLRRQVEAVRVQQSIAAITHTDLVQAEAAYQQTQSTLATARGQLRASEATYLHEVGEAPGMLAEPKGLPKLPVTRDEAIAMAEDGAPAVQQAKYAVEAADDQLDAKRRELLPTLSVVGEVNIGTQSETIHSRVDTKQVMAQLSIPLFDGGVAASQSRADVAVRSQRQSELIDTRQSAVEAAQQAWDQLEATRQGLASLRQKVNLQVQVVQDVSNELSLGTRRIYDLLLQEQDLFQAKINMVQAEHDLVLYEASLARAVGTLTAQGLALPVQDYDPRKNFDAVHHAWIGLGGD